MPATADDPVSVIHALLAAENAHDIDAAMALFAEDAVADLAVERRTGHDEIRAWQQSLAEGHFHMELRGEPEVTGNTVRFPNRLDLDMFKNLGLGTVEAVSTAVIEDGKIRHYTFALTPEYLTRLQAALASGRKLEN